MLSEAASLLIVGILLGAGLLAAVWWSMERWQHRRRGMVTAGRYREICTDCDVPSSHLLGGRWEAETIPPNGLPYGFLPQGKLQYAVEGNVLLLGATCRDCFRSTGTVAADCGQCDGTGIDSMPPTDVHCDGCGHVLLADEDPVFRLERPFHELCAEGVDKAVAMDGPDREVFEVGR